MSSRLSKWASAVLAGLLTVTGTVTLAPAARAIESCYIAAAPRYLTSGMTGSYALAPSQLTVYWDQNPAQDCIVSTRFRFIGSGAQDFQDVPAPFTREGSRVKAVGSFVPKPGLSYTVEAFITWQMMGSPYEAYPTTLTLNGGRPFADPPVPAGQGAPNVSGVDRTLRIGWAPPTSNPGAVKSYFVTNASSGAIVCDVPASTLGCTLSDQPDGDYVFAVTAVGLYIGSAASGGSSPIRIGAPGSPTITRASVSKNRAVLEWQLPMASTATLNAFTVTDSAGRAVCRVPGFATTCSPLLPPKGRSTRYVVTVETSMGNAASQPSRALRRR